jgi:hypothetical protein
MTVTKQALATVECVQAIGATSGGSLNLKRPAGWTVVERVRAGLRHAACTIHKVHIETTKQTTYTMVVYLSICKVFNAYMQP